MTRRLLDVDILLNSASTALKIVTAALQQGIPKKPGIAEALQAGIIAVLGQPIFAL